MPTVFNKKVVASSTILCGTRWRPSEERIFLTADVIASPVFFAGRGNPVLIEDQNKPHWIASLAKNAPRNDGTVNACRSRHRVPHKIVLLATTFLLKTVGTIFTA